MFASKAKIYLAAFALFARLWAFLRLNARQLLLGTPMHSDILIIGLDSIYCLASF